MGCTPDLRAASPPATASRPPGGKDERHSSSGVLVSTGTGATGWCHSVWLERHSTVRLPEPSEPTLVWFVREARPSPATGTEETEGSLTAGESIIVIAESDGLAVFGDGIESDHLTLVWGQQVSIRLAETALRLVRPLPSPNGRVRASGRLPTRACDAPEPGHRPSLVTSVVDHGVRLPLGFGWPALVRSILATNRCTRSAALTAVSARSMWSSPSRARS